MGPDSVTIRLDIEAQSVFELKADGLQTASTLSGSMEPNFPEDFHDILIFGVLADEYRKAEKDKFADRMESSFAQRLSDLRMFIAKSSYLDIRQGQIDQTRSPFLATGGGSGSSSIGGGTSYTQTGLITFDRDPNSPFAVTSGSAKVDNLDADKLDGLDSTAFVQTVVSTDNAITRFNGIAGQIQNSSAIVDDSGNLTATNFSGTSSGTNTGDVTLAGSPNYLTIAAQVITRALIDLTSHITGRLPFANLTASSAASKLLGRGSASGAGDFQEITLGSGLSMSGTTLSGTPPGGSDTQVQFNDSSSFGGDSGLTYNKTTDALTIAGQLIISGASAGQIVFPATQNASTNANTLDDYEEGTFTPTISGTGGASSQTYSVQSAKYLKIGKRVFVQGRITLSNLGTITGGVTISGLPFASENTSNGYAAVNIGYWANFAGGTFRSVAGYISPNVSYLELYGNSGAATSFAALAQADLTNTTDFVFSASYTASA